MRIAMLLLLAAPLAAQTPVPVEPASPASVLTEPLAAVRDNPWSADLLIGLPTAVRLQCRHPEYAVWFETGIGAYLIVPTVFAGVRGEGKMLETKHHCVSVRPGLDFYYFQGYEYHSGGFFGGGDIPTMGGAVVDFDLQWKARWCDRFHGTAGLKIGCGAAVGREGGVPVPVIGLTLGGSF